MSNPKLIVENLDFASIQNEYFLGESSTGYNSTNFVNWNLLVAQGVNDVDLGGYPYPISNNLYPSDLLSLANLPFKNSS